MKIHISRGNSKIGRIPNVSLPPVITCGADVPCKELCYARKFYNNSHFRGVRNAWDENYALWRFDHESYFDQIWTFLGNKKPPRFRWHVSGDVPNTHYWYYVKATAIKFPDTAFALYTKRDFVLKDPSVLPVNLHVRRSVWINEDIPPGSPPAFVTVLKPTKIYGFECIGGCANCWRCYAPIPNNAPTFIHLH